MIKATGKRSSKEEIRFRPFFRSVSCRKYPGMLKNLLQVNLISVSVRN